MQKIYAVDQHDFGSELAKSLTAQLEQDAPAIAATLFGKKPPETVNMSRDAYLGMLRRNWGNQDFRVKALQNVGPNQFIQDAVEAGMYNEALYPQMQAMAEMMGVPNG